MNSSFSILEISEKSWQQEFSEYDVVVRCPCSAFIFGEHSVMYGNPALYYPIPFYVYVGIKKIEKTNSFFRFDSLRYINPADFNLYNLPSEKDFESKIMTLSIDGSKFKNGNTINEIFENVLQIKNIDNRFANHLKELKNRFSFEVKMLFYIPTSCGLNSSGAFSSALATALALYTGFIGIGEVEKWRGNDIFGSPEDIKFCEIYKIAWMIECAFHFHASSGAGVMGGMLGGDEKQLPFVFYTEERSLISGENNTTVYPVRFFNEEDGYKNYLKLLDKIQIRAVRGSYLTQKEINPTDYEICLIYSGDPSKTETVIMEVEEYFRRMSSREFVNDMSPEDFIKEFSKYNPDQKMLLMRERIFTNLGRVSRCGINFFFGNDLDNLVTAINLYQELLIGLNVSSENIESIREIFTNANANVATKLTGCGKGGDILIFGRKAIKQDLEKNKLDEMRSNLSFAHGVHYTSWIMSEAVKPVSIREFRRKVDVS